MWFEPHSVTLDALQATCVALPGAGLPRRLDRLRARWWALALPLSIALVVGVIGLLPASAGVFTWVAIILVPIGCAIALGWAMRGARPWLALLCVPLLVAAWTPPTRSVGQLAATLLIAGSAIALGRLVAGASAPALLKLGVVAMVAVDAYLVFSNQLQAPNAVLMAARPAAGVPQLQTATFGRSDLGYGDFFAAAVVGGVLAREGRPRLRAAVALLVMAFCCDQLFAVYDVLPATVPPLVLIGSEIMRQGRRLRQPAFSGRSRGRASPEGSRHPRRIIEPRRGGGDAGAPPPCCLPHRCRCTPDCAWAPPDGAPATG
jgi:hypothetical protein